MPAALYDGVPSLAVFCVRVPDDLAARFDAAAGLHGGRSARLRQLIGGDAEGARVRRTEAPTRREAARLMVRLAAAEAAHVSAEARKMHLRPAGWVAALVRRHASARPRFSRPDELSLIAVQAELRRIGVNVNQIARALNTAVLEGRVLDTELTAVDDLRRQLRSRMAGLREAFEGNLAYWDVDL